MKKSIAYEADQKRKEKKRTVRTFFPLVCLLDLLLFISIEDVSASFCVSFCHTASSKKLLVVCFNEGNILETRVLKEVHKEALMRRGLGTNNNERNDPLAEAIAKKRRTLVTGEKRTEQRNKRQNTY